MLEVTQNDDSIHVRLLGEMTIFQADELFSLLKPLVNDSKDLTLDTAAVSEMDSSVVQVLLVLRESLKASNKQLALINHSDAVLDIMAVMGMSGCFNDPVVERLEPVNGGTVS